MSVAISFNQYDLPWSTGFEEGRRFRRLMTSSLAFVIIFGSIVPFLPLPEIERDKLEELPPQLARIVLEKPEPVIPPPPPIPEVKNEPKPEPEKKPIPKVEPKVEKPIPQPTVADAREKAAVSGLLQFQDAFADMREAVDMNKLTDTASLSRGSGEAATIDRSVLTSKHGTRSAGVNVTALSRDTGGVALSGRETTKVDAPVGITGTGGNRKNNVVGADPRGRSIEEIRRVFDTNKGAIFAIYNRALRQDPGLQGQVVLELVIDPTGRVLECRVVSTEIGDGDMVAKVVNRIRMFDFGKRDVGTTTISYPVSFLPT